MTSFIRARVIATFILLRSFRNPICPSSGLGGVFPPDVLVGVIKELTPEASGKSTLAVIQPGADPRTVRHVFIITNY